MSMQDQRGNVFSLSRYISEYHGRQYLYYA